MEKFCVLEIQYLVPKQALSAEAEDPYVDFN
jgi:hypothetical protein